MRIRFIQEFIDAFRGKRQKVHGVKYFLTSCDKVDNKLIKITQQKNQKEKDILS